MNIKKIFRLAQLGNKPLRPELSNLLFAQDLDLFCTLFFKSLKKEQRILTKEQKRKIDEEASNIQKITENEKFVFYFLKNKREANILSLIQSLKNKNDDSFLAQGRMSLIVLTKQQFNNSHIIFIAEQKTDNFYFFQINFNQNLLDDAVSNGKEHETAINKVFFVHTPSIKLTPSTRSIKINITPFILEIYAEQMEQNQQILGAILYYALKNEAIKESLMIELKGIILNFFKNKQKLNEYQTSLLRQILVMSNETFPELEKFIIQDDELSFIYAVYCLGTRFLAGEKTIAKNQELWKTYLRHFK